MHSILTTDRRALLQRALLLVGAAAVPGMEALAAPARSGRRQLGAARFALLTAVADTILPRTDTPGAVDAGVPERLDAMLGSWASAAQRVQLTAALDEIDVLARGEGAAGFAKLKRDQRHRLLAAHDEAAMKMVMPAPPPPEKVAAAVNGQSGTGAPASVLVRRRPAFANPGYAKLKELIVLLYYVSEAALTHELPYEHAPGRWQPSIPVTPQTRTYGGL